MEQDYTPPSSVDSTYNISETVELWECGFCGHISFEKHEKPFGRCGSCGGDWWEKLKEVEI